MKRADAAAWVGKPVHVTPDGDLWMCADLRPVLTYPGETTGPVSYFVRLSKGGMAIVSLGNRNFSVPPRNVIEATTSSLP